MNNFLSTKVKSLAEKKFLRIWFIFSVIALISYLIRYPTDASFELVFGDLGAAFKADELVSEGYAPTVDFAYLYGLLPLAIGRGWFAVFGAMPIALFSGIAICYVFSTAALARIVVTANIGLLGIIFIGVSIPFFTFGFQYFHFTYALEPTFILWALAAHLAGKKGKALAFLVFGYFIKPSMSLVYMALVLGLYAKDLVKGKMSINSIRQEILPALLVLTFLLTSLSVMFGFASVIGSILSPIQGTAHYKAMDFGLFSSDFLFFAGVKSGYYAGSAGVWIVCTVILFITAILFVYKILVMKQNNFKNSSVLEVICAIAILHLIVSFRNPNLGYSYLLTICMALFDSEYVVTVNNQIKKVLIFLTTFLLVGFYPGISYYYNAWSHFNPQPSTLWLSSTPELKSEFSEVLSHCQTKKVLILGASTGGVDVFFPQCKSTNAWWLLKGVYNRTEIERVNNQISQSTFIVLPNNYQGLSHINTESYQKELSKFQEYKKGKYFEFLKRIN